MESKSAAGELQQHRTAHIIQDSEFCLLNPGFYLSRGIIRAQAQQTLITLEFVLAQIL